jgi:hypothetical protein
MGRFIENTRNDHVQMEKAGRKHMMRSFNNRGAE